MFWCSLIMHPHPFDIILCIITGICLSTYNLFSFIIHQTSYLKGYKWYFIHREVLVRIDKMLLNNKCEMNWPRHTMIWFCCMRMSYADSLFQAFSPLTKCRPDLGPNNHLQLLKYLINPCYSRRIYRYSSFFRKRGSLLLIHIHDIFFSDWSSVSDMARNNFLCTPFVEVLTFAILWIGLSIETEPVGICRIKSYIIKITLNVTALYFEDPALYLTSFRTIFTSAQDRKLSFQTCYEKYDIVYYLLHSRLWLETFEKKMKFEVFSFL